MESSGTVAVAWQTHTLELYIISGTVRLKLHKTKLAIAAEHQLAPRVALVVPVDHYLPVHQVETACVLQVPKVVGPAFTEPRRVLPSHAVRQLPIVPRGLPV